MELKNKPDLEDSLKRIRAAGKSLVIDLQRDEFEPFMEAIL